MFENLTQNRSYALLAGWTALSSLAAFLMFGYDKWLAKRGGPSRVKEFHLVLIGALGGWVGGLLAMLAFRHKTSKLSFQVKYVLGLIVWVAWLYFAIRARPAR